MLSVGETLKRARLKQGLDLPTISARTRISLKFLEAIECDDRASLPNGIFYKSFVAQYANALSVDAQEIDAEVDRVLAADAPLPLPDFAHVMAHNAPHLRSAHHFRTKSWYSIVLVIVVALLAGIASGIYWWRAQRAPFSLKGAIPGLLRTNAFATPNRQAKPAPAVVANNSPPHEVAPPQELPQQPPAEPKSPLATISAESTPLGTPAAPPRSPSTTPALVSSDYKVMLDLMAHEATWLSVSCDGKPAFSGILRANETKTLGSKEFATMRVGNAAGIEVRLNGKLLGPLGAHGQVLVVRFTPDHFHIVTPPRESD